MDAAGRTLAGGALVVTAANLWLIRTGRRTVSQAVRDNRWAWCGFNVLFGLHVADRLGTLDPFHAIGRCIPPRAAD